MHAYYNMCGDEYTFLFEGCPCLKLPLCLGAVLSARFTPG